jgi:hypothetical protein
MTFQVKKAKRHKLKAVIGFIGPSGSGKTAGALIVAYGMMKAKYPEAPEEFIWEKIGVADTEHGRSLLYVDATFDNVRVGEFQHIDFNPPFSTDRYNNAVKALKQTGCEVIIIDSLSHNWQGEGGIVETHANMAGNSFQNWGKLGSETTSLIKTLTRNDVHILCTLRTKTEYVVEQSETGKAIPKKIGLAPVQKNDMEYEFMINFNIDHSHKTNTSKDNSRLFEGREFTINEFIGEKLYKWLEEGIDVKGEEEKERLNLIEITRGVVEEVGLQTKLDELEKKAKMKLEDMPIAWVEKAYSLMHYAADELKKTQV